MFHENHHLFQPNFCSNFRVEYIPKNIEKIISSKNITTNVYRIQANDSIMNGYYDIRFFNFILKGNILLDYTNFLSSNKYERNDKITSKYFQ